MTVSKDEEENSKDKKGDNDDEIAIALVAECHVGDKKFKAGETWTDPKHECRMSICNPGGAISYLECPRFELDEGDEIRIPGENKYAYPHCCDYVFHTKKKKKKLEDGEGGKQGVEEDKDGKEEKDGADEGNVKGERGDEDEDEGGGKEEEDARRKDKGEDEGKTKDDEGAVKEGDDDEEEEKNDTPRPSTPS